MAQIITNDVKERDFITDNTEAIVSSYAYHMLLPLLLLLLL